MSEDIVSIEAEVLKQEIFNAISRLESLGSDVLDDQVLCHAIIRLRELASTTFAAISASNDVHCIEALMSGIFNEVVSLQDRVIASMEGGVQYLTEQAAIRSSSDRLH